MGADSSDIYRSLEQRIDNVMILGGVLKTEPKSKQKTGTGNRALGGSLANFEAFTSCKAMSYV